MYLILTLVKIFTPCIPSPYTFEAYIEVPYLLLTLDWMEVYDMRLLAYM